MTIIDRTSSASGPDRIAPTTLAPDSSLIIDLLRDIQMKVNDMGVVHRRDSGMYPDEYLDSAVASQSGSPVRQTTPLNVAHSTSFGSRKGPTFVDDDNSFAERYQAYLPEHRRMRNGQIYVSPHPERKFASSAEALSWLKSAGTWSIQDTQTKADNVSWIRYFGCKFGGHAVARNIRCRAGETARGFAAAAASEIRCKAKMIAEWNDHLGLLFQYFLVNEPHEHTSDVFSLKFAKLDGTLGLLDRIVEMSVGNPVSSPSIVLSECSRELHNEKLPFPIKHKLIQQFAKISDTPSLMQELARVVARAREETSPMVLEELEQMILEDVRIREDLNMKNLSDGICDEVAFNELHRPYMIGINRLILNGAVVKIGFSFATTSWLLRAAAGLNGTIFVDGTFGMITCGYKVIVVGVETCHRKFYPVCIGVVREESTAEYGYIFSQLKTAVEDALAEAGNAGEWTPSAVMADGAASITAAAKKVFPSALRLQCFFHFKQNMQRHLKLILKDDKLTASKIESDLQLLGNARSESQFKFWILLFKRKWATQPACLDMIDRPGGYIDLNSSSCGWYWGAGGPSGLWSSRTNNGTEAFNKILHSNWVRRTQLTLRRFLRVVGGNDMRDNSYRGYILPVTWDFTGDLAKPIWREAKIFHENGELDYAKELVGIHWIEPDASSTVAYIWDGSSFVFGVTDDADVYSILSGQYNIFDQRTIDWCITYIPNDDQQYPIPPPNGPCCTCVTYILKNLCKHVLALICVDRTYQWDSSVVRIGQPSKELGTRRPRVPRTGRRAHLDPFGAHAKAAKAVACKMKNDKLKLLRNAQIGTLVAVNFCRVLEIGELVENYVTGSVSLVLLRRSGNYFSSPVCCRQRSKNSVTVKVQNIVKIGVELEEHGWFDSSQI